MLRGGLLWLILTVPVFQALGQTSQTAFQFVKQSSFTRLSGLGGVNLTSTTDPLFFLQNPASLDSTNENIGSFHYLNFPGGINWGTAGYQWAPEFGGQFAIGLQFVSYGTFDGFDQFGISTGEFSALEFNLQAGYARKRGVFTYGASIKLLGSFLESYQAYALVFDFGVNYKHPVEDFRLGMTVRNLGLSLGTYLPDQKLRLPQDVRFGASFKPKYMPLRFHWTLRNLNSTEQNLEQVEGFGRQAFEKMVWGVEILPAETVSLMVGYNQLIRNQFTGNSGAAAAGFSGGFAFRVKQFEFSYSRAFYNVAGASNLFGISTNFINRRAF
ncbi:type IX secretion system protein PorQ [Algoriphagus namhaensis]|uniref:Type IX secretion system protein PorQ n=1 Tax=Algoriphagus namhaensis TaxID=915353 RepID=A0ABV8APE9_9BACT